MKKFSKEEKNNMVNDWKASNKNMSQWAKETGIPQSTFYGWAKPFRKKDLNIKKFIEIHEEPTSIPDINITIHGISISISKI